MSLQRFQINPSDKYLWNNLKAAAGQIKFRSSLTLKIFYRFDFIQTERYLHLCPAEGEERPSLFSYFSPNPVISHMFTFQINDYAMHVCFYTTKIMDTVE